MRNVSVIIPCFGEESLLHKCLEALEANTEASEGNLETLLVMNGVDWDAKADAVIHNPTNKGFAVANNQASNIAHGEILCLLNMDTEVQPGWLPPLLAAFDDPEVAMCGPRIIHPDGSLQTASGIRTWHGGGSAGGEELKIDGPTCDADGVTAACMLIRNDVYCRFGGLCDQYKNGYEDVDLCLTVREAGLRVRFIAESTIIHHESASGPERWAHSGANVALMNQRWGNR